MASTPWGGSDYQKNIVRGITFFGTPGHGGFRCSTKMYQEACKRHNLLPKSPDHYDTESYTWFEEDCDWAHLCIAFPEHFSEKDLKAAESTLKDNYPDHWEQWKGIELKPGESSEKDKRMFFKEHANDFMAVSTQRLPGSNLILVTATPGGRKYPIMVHVSKFFIIPEDKYYKQTEDRKFTAPYLIESSDLKISPVDAEILKNDLDTQMEKCVHEFVAVNYFRSCTGKPLVECQRKADYKSIWLEVDPPVWEQRDSFSIHVAKRAEDGSWTIEKMNSLASEKMQWRKNGNSLCYEKRESPELAWSIPGKLTFLLSSITFKAARLNSDENRIEFDVKNHPNLLYKFVDPDFKGDVEIKINYDFNSGVGDLYATINRDGFKQEEKRVLQEEEKGFFEEKMDAMCHCGFGKSIKDFQVEELDSDSPQH